MTLDPNTVETWNFVNSFAPRLAALGSIAAVVTSLFLAFRQTAMRLHVTAAHRLTVRTGLPLLPPEVLHIDVVNVGFRDVEVTAIEWKASLFRRQCLLQTTCNDGFSSRLPIRLLHGQRAQYYLPFDSWIAHMRDHLRPFPHLQARLLGLQARTSVGPTIGGHVEKQLRREIIKSIR